MSYPLRMMAPAAGLEPATCRASRTLSEAGKKLFGVSRQGRKSVNDADRLSKYLARFNLDFRRLKTPGGA